MNLKTKAFLHWAPISMISVTLGYLDLSMSMMEIGLFYRFQQKNLRCSRCIGNRQLSFGRKNQEIDLTWRMKINAQKNKITVRLPRVKKLWGVAFEEFVWCFPFYVLNFKWWAAVKQIIKNPPLTFLSILKLP